MKKNTFLVAAVLTLTASISTSADLVGVDWILGPNQHPDGLHTTFQIVARFTDVNDQIGAVSCGMGIDLEFWTSDGSDIYNQELFAGLPFKQFDKNFELNDKKPLFLTLDTSNFGKN